LGKIKIENIFFGALHPFLLMLILWYDALAGLIYFYLIVFFLLFTILFISFSLGGMTMKIVMGTPGITGGVAGFIDNYGYQ